MLPQKILLHLTLIEGVGCTLINKLYTQFSQKEFSQLYEYSIDDFLRYGISQKKAERIVAGLKDKALLDKELELIERHHVSLVSIFDDDYPFLLKNIHYYPPILYMRGARFDDVAHHLALVGSRMASRYCTSTLDVLLPPLINQGWVTVSGGARGADTFVHQKTVELKGRTIVVLGSGLLRIYPRENQKLFNNVLDSGGTLLSIFPLTTGPSPQTFPARNRVISGLSSGTVVLQAAEKSGALITAHYALEQGREVFAVPGPFDSELSAGPHSLIKQGAQLVTSALDIFEALKFTCTEDKQMKAQKSQKESASWTSSEKMIMEHCHVPRSIDDLANLTELAYEKIHEILFDLQMSGLMQQDHAGLWHHR